MEVTVTVKVRETVTVIIMIKRKTIYQCECHDFCSFGLENTSVKIAKGTLHLILHLKLKNNAFIGCVIPNFVDTLYTLFPQFTRITLKYKIQTHTLQQTKHGPTC